MLKSKQFELTYSDAIADAIIEEMQMNEDIFVIGVEVGKSRGGIGKVMSRVKEKVSSDRIVDTPLAESLITGAAAGAAMVGMRPIAELLSADYIPLASDGIINTAAKMRYSSGGKLKIPVVYRVAYGSSGMVDMWESQNLEAWMTHIPGLKVVVPSNPYDAKGLMKSAIRDDNPVMFFEHKSLYKVKEMIPDEEYVIPIGKSEIKVEGNDITIISYGIMVKEAIKAAEILSQEGISTEVIDLRTLTPLDKKTIIDSVKKTGRVLITHRANKTSGFGAEIAAVIGEEAFDCLKGPILRVTTPDTPLPWSPPLKEYYLSIYYYIVNSVKQIKI
jgi:pyruvate dehydrogenase E1 component beta subunit